VVSDVVARALLTALTLAVFALGAYGMWRGWRRKARRQQHLLPLPTAPSGRAGLLLPAATGLYVGTTISGDWQARVVAGQLSDRSAGTLRLTAAGVLVDRVGAPAVFVPAEALRDARLDAALAGKVMGEGRLLVLTWEHRGALLDTAFRADQHTVHVPYLHAVLGLVNGAAKHTNLGSDA
jgi:hypothetical protein